MTGPTRYVPATYDITVDLDLSRNEGRTRATELLAAVIDPDRDVSRYPDLSKVRSALASIHGLDPSQILVTAGGDDALNRAFQALVKNGQRAVTTYPTFEMIAHYAEQQRVDLVEVPWWDEPFPTETVVQSTAADTDALFVVSPNNPTGATISEADLRSISAAFPFVVLDAAYVEFGDDDLTPTAVGLGNVVVIRTLSKAYGLAGLRIGFLLGSPDVVARIGAYGSPYPVSSLSASLAETRLSWPVSELYEFVARVRSEREDLTKELVRLGTRPFASQANFVLTEVEDAPWLISAARSLGIALRGFPYRPGMEGMVRITLPGDRSDYDRLVATLGAALMPQALIFGLEGVLGDMSGLRYEERPLVTADVWRRWASRFPLGVVTGRHRADAEEFLGRFGLLDSVSALVTRDDAPLKPEPALLDLILERLGVARAWMLGNTPDDIAAARGAGVVPIGVVAPGADPVWARTTLRFAARILEKTTDLEVMLT